MNPLRQRMIEDLRIRNYSEQTIDTYVRRVAAFAAHFGRSPAELGSEHIRTYQVFLVNEKKASRSELARAASALRFLYKVTLHDKVPVERIPCPKGEKKLPVVLSPAELKVFFWPVSRVMISAAAFRSWTPLAISALTLVRPDLP